MKKKYIKVAVPATADTDYRLGLWQIELLMRINRIYRKHGPKACTIDSVFGFQKYKYDFELRKVKPVFIKHKGTYMQSAAMLVKHGYISPYYKCGYKEDKMGFIPADAPEATIQALENGLPLEDHFSIGAALKDRKLKAERKKEIYEARKAGKEPPTWDKSDVFRRMYPGMRIVSSQ